MSIAVDPTTTSFSTTTRRPRPGWLVATVATVASLVAAAATELFALGARLVGVPMAAGDVGSAVAKPLPAGCFAMGTVTCAVVGVLLAVVLGRFAARPSRTYLVVTVALTVLSLAAPLLAPAAVSTRIVLMGAHLIAAAIIIPVTARRLARTRA